METNSFKNEIERLINLFKKITEENKSNSFGAFNPIFHKNVEFMIKNYEMIKDTIPDDYINELGAPLRQMIKDYIKQLESELNIKTDSSDESVTTPVNEKNTTLTIEDIDKQLQKAGLSYAEINELLDKRNELIKKLHKTN